MNKHIAPTPYVYDEVGDIVGVKLADYTQLAIENDALLAQRDELVKALEIARFDLALLAKNINSTAADPQRALDAVRAALSQAAK